MSRLLKKHSKILKTLIAVDLRLAERIISNADNGIVKCISEIAYNVLYGNVSLTPKEKRVLKD